MGLLTDLAKEIGKEIVSDIITERTDSNSTSENIPTSILFTPYPRWDGVFMEDQYKDSLVKLMLVNFGRLLKLEDLFPRVNYEINYDGGTALSFVITNAKTSIIYGMFGMGYTAVTIYGKCIREIVEEIKVFFEENEDQFLIEQITTQRIDYHNNDLLLSAKDRLEKTWSQKRAEISKSTKLAKRYMTYQTEALSFLFGWQSGIPSDDIKKVNSFMDLMYGDDFNTLSSEKIKKLNNNSEEDCFNWLFELEPKNIIAVAKAVYATCLGCLLKEYSDRIQEKIAFENDESFTRWCKNFNQLKKNMLIDEFDELYVNIPHEIDNEINPEYVSSYYESCEIIKKLGEEK